MAIPVGFAHVTHVHTSPLVPDSMQLTYGIAAADYTQAKADALSTEYATRWLPVIDASVRFTQTKVQVGTGGGGDLVFESSAGQADGATQFSEAPFSNAVVIAKLTGRGGRPYRGRMYMVGILNEANVDGSGQLDGTVRNAIQTRADAWLIALGNLGQQMHLLHTRTDVFGIPPTPVTSLLVRQRIGTQRRRIR